MSIIYNEGGMCVCLLAWVINYKYFHINLIYVLTIFSNYPYEKLIATLLGYVITLHNGSTEYPICIILSLTGN